MNTDQIQELLTRVERANPGWGPAEQAEICNDIYNEEHGPKQERNLVPPGAPLRFDIRPEILTQIQTCPWAKTAIATHPQFANELLLVMPCKRWGCPVCSAQKIKALARAVNAAAPNRLLTLTTDTKLHDNGELAWLETKAKPTELFRSLRVRKIKLQYLKVTELTSKGYPHYHCLLRSDYLPQPVVKAIWKRLTGSTIVDVRQVTNAFNAYSYLVKYLTKLHRLDWTDRHVSYSRGMFAIPPLQDDWSADLKIKIVGHEDEHPYAYMHRHYNGRTLTRISPYRWLLNSIENEHESEPPYTELGLTVPQKPHTPKERLLIEF